MFYFDPTMLLLIPGLLLGLWAQYRVKSAYARWSNVSTGLPSSQVVVGELLQRNAPAPVAIQPIPGQLTDHYNPSTNTLGLSEGVYGSTSVAALGIATHEAGHALQQAEGYGPLKLRTLAVPVVNIGSTAAIPLFILGVAASWQPLMYIGIAAFGLSVLFALITLPVEFDASRRAVAMLQEGGYLTGETDKGVRAVLNAAAMTYVAAAISALLNLLRLLLIANSRRRD